LAGALQNLESPAIHSGTNFLSYIYGKFFDTELMKGIKQRAQGKPAQIVIHRLLFKLFS